MIMIFGVIMFFWSSLSIFIKQRRENGEQTVPF